MALPDQVARDNGARNWELEMLIMEIVVGAVALFVVGYTAWIAIVVGPGSPNIR
jgi:hypothetical protein